MIEKMYTAKQISEILGISPRTVQNYVSAGVLKGTLIGRNRRFAESEVLEIQKNGVPKDYFKKLKGKEK